MLRLRYWLLLLAWAFPLSARSADVDQYGDPLPEGARARLGTIRLRSEHGFGHIVLSADGKTFSGGYSTILWDITSGKRSTKKKEPLQFGCLPERMKAGCVTPDGKTFVAASLNESVDLWNLTHATE